MSVQRSYNVSLPHNKIPDALCQLAKNMAAPAMPVGEEFHPEAAIVNYFGSGTTFILILLDPYIIFLISFFKSYSVINMIAGSIESLYLCYVYCILIYSNSQVTCWVVTLMTWRKIGVNLL